MIYKIKIETKMDFIKLQLPLSGKISKVIHLSDLHIRSGNRDISRYNEYFDVFTNLIKLLSKENCIINNTTVIVLTGDIFHNKNKLEPSGINLFNYLLTELSNLAPVYVILGNHDYRQDENDTIDMLSSFLNHNTFKNVSYLEQTGHYYANDVGFGLVNVKDTLKIGDTGSMVDELPKFPDPERFTENIKTKIAIFHGTIIEHSLLDNYSNALSGVPLEWFTGYDYGMFGDIHLQQVHTSKVLPQWGYSGSLIQQSFGESIQNHGYLIWDIENNKVESKNVYNNNGFLKLEFVKNDWYILMGKNQNKKDKLLDCINDSMFPKNLKIRIHGTVTYDNIIDLKVMLKDFKYEFCSQLINSTNLSSDKNIKNNKETCDFFYLNNKDTWIKYIENIDSDINSKFSNWKDWIISPKTLLIDTENMPKNIIDKIVKRNNEIEVSIDKMNDFSDNNIVKNKLSLCYIHFEGILCFAEKNYFNFTNMQGSVALISALNGFGKSSFLETICLAIFGDSIPSRSNKANSASILSLNRKTSVNPSTRIIIKIKDTYYEIYRVFRAQQDKTKVLIYKTELSIVEYIDDIPNTKVLKSGGRAVSDWIKDNIGTLDNFLLSTMITQNQDSNFFNMKPEQQTSLLDKCLHFDSINSLTNIFKISINIYKYILDHLDTTFTDITSNIVVFDEENFRDTSNKLKELEDEYIKMESRYVNILDDWEYIWKNNDMISDFELNDEDIKNNISNFTTMYNEINIDTSYEEILLEKGGMEVKISDLKKYLCNNYNKNITVEEIKNEPEIPLLSQEIITLNEKNIEEWKNKWKTLNKDYINYNENIKLLKKKEKNKKEIESKINDIDFDKIDETVSSYDYKTWLKVYTLFTDNVDKFGVYNSSIIEPSVSEEELKKQKENLENEKNEYNELLNVSNADYENNFSLIKNEYLFNEKRISNDTKILNTLQNNISIKEIEHNKHYSSLKNLENCNKPEITIEEINENLSNFIKLNKSIKTKTKKLENYNSLINTYNTYENTIVDLNNKLNDLTLKITECNQFIKEIPFNPECYACCKNPQRIHLKILKENFDLLTCKLNETRDIQIKNLEENDIIKLQKEQSKLNLWFETYNLLSSKSEFYSKQLEQFKAYNNYVISKESLYSLIEASNNELTNLRDKLKNNTILIDSVKNKQNSLKHTIDSYTYIEKNKDSWNSRSIFIEIQENLWIDYKSNLQNKSYYEKKILFEKQKLYWSKLDLHNDYSIKLHVIYDEINTINDYMKDYEMYINETKEYDTLVLRNSKEKKQLNIWNTWNINNKSFELNKLLKKLEEYTIHQNEYSKKELYKDKITYWTNVSESKEYFIEKQLLKDKIDKNKSEIDILKYKVLLLIEEEKIHKNNMDKSKKLNNTIQILKNKYEALTTLSYNFSNYRQWVYKCNILPKIVEKCNLLIKPVSSKLTLDFSIDDKNKISWYMKRENNLINIEKSSGFENFMLSVALRISLSMIGASSVSCSLLILDEGFVACDTNHIQKIPEFIQSLLSLYDSVLLVSHLSIIADSVDIKIPIIRNGSISTIKYGNEYNKPLLKNFITQDI